MNEIDEEVKKYFMSLGYDYSWDFSTGDRWHEILTQHEMGAFRNLVDDYRMEWGC